MPAKASIHPSALLSSGTKIGNDVTIGPFTMLGDCIIGSRAIIHPHVVIGDGVVIGEGCEIFPGAFVGKEPKGAGATSRAVAYERRVVIGTDCSIGPNATIYYDVDIGPNTLIGDSASIREQCRIGARCILSRCVTVNYNTIVGDDVKIMDLTHLTGNMVIENNVFVSAMVGSANDNIVRAGYGDHVVGPVIESGAVIGLGAMLLPGVRIGRGATVGAGALVTRDVAPSDKVVGVPAKPV